MKIVFLSFVTLFFSSNLYAQKGADSVAELSPQSVCKSLGYEFFEKFESNDWECEIVPFSKGVQFELLTTNIDQSVLKPLSEICSKNNGVYRIKIYSGAGLGSRHGTASVDVLFVCEPNPDPSL